MNQFNLIFSLIFSAFMNMILHEMFHHIATLFIDDIYVTNWGFSLNKMYVSIDSKNGFENVKNLTFKMFFISILPIFSCMISFIFSIYVIYNSVELAITSFIISIVSLIYVIYETLYSVSESFFWRNKKR